MEIRSDDSGNCGHNWRNSGHCDTAVYHCSVVLLSAPGEHTHTPVIISLVCFRIKGTIFTPCLKCSQILEAYSPMISLVPKPPHTLNVNEASCSDFSSPS